MPCAKNFLVIKSFILKTDQDNKMQIKRKKLMSAYNNQLARFSYIVNRFEVSIIINNWTKVQLRVASHVLWTTGILALLSKSLD